MPDLFNRKALKEQREFIATQGAELAAKKNTIRKLLEELEKCKSTLHTLEKELQGYDAKLRKRDEIRIKALKTIYSRYLSVKTKLDKNLDATRMLNNIEDMLSDRQK